MHLKHCLPTSNAFRKHRRLLLSLSLTAIVVIAVLVSAVSLALATSPSFPDVPASHPYYTAITDLASRGIINGYGNGNFGPGDPVTRQQFAKMVVLTGGYPVSEANVCYFTDVEKSDASTLYPDNYIAVAASNGITTGKTPTTFDPTGFITRYQVVSMVVRMADNLHPGLLVAPPAGYSTGAGWENNATHGANAARAAYNGILAGLDLTALSPLGNMNRGEVAQVLHNLLVKLTPVTTTTTASTTTTTQATTTTTSSTTTTSTTSTSTTSTTVFGGGQGNIAFVSNRDGNAEIYVGNVDGSGLARLTNNPEIDDWPDWSPDGSKIAFTRYTGGAPDIYVMNANGSLQTNISTNAAWDSDPSWSPDGSRIAFDSNRGGGALQIWIMNANGSGPLQITSTVQLNDSPDWSPDGNRICFESERDGQREIYVMNADGTAPTRLTFSGNNYGPQWSPDGSRIVFASNTHIWSIRPDGTGLTQLTISPGFDANPAWSPDSSKIVFSSNRGGDFELWVVKADGTGLQQIINSSGYDIDASWH